MAERPKADPAVDLVLDRVVPAPAGLLWRGWTEPDLLVRWFTPAPWETVACEIDLRPGGVFSTTMRSPGGETQPPSTGCFLEVEPERRLTFTDALGPGFRPLGAGFITATILLEPEGAGTRYTALVRHADAAGRSKHESMGFATGWGAALDQLVELTRSL